MPKANTRLKNAQSIISDYGLSGEDFSDDELIRFRDSLDGLDDKRHQSYVRHRMSDIIIMVFLALLANVDEWDEIEVFLDIRADWFIKLLDLRHGIPCHDTMQSVIGSLEPQALTEICLGFIIGKINIYSEMARHDDPFRKPGKSIISIDGKTSRGSAGKDAGNGKIRPLHTLNAVSSDYGFCIGQVFVPEKTNEITAVGDLLDLIDVSDTVVTWDALNTQKDNVRKVIDKKGDYVVALKANHGSLLEEVRDYLCDDGLLKNNPLVEYHETKEKEHGFVITRQYIISKEVDWIYDRKSWAGLGAIGCCKKTAAPLKGGDPVTETRYYLSSVTDVSLFARSVRQHWSVEAFHWQMDFTFRDDSNRTRDKKSAKNLQIMKKTALALLTLVKPMYRKRISIKNIRLTICTNFEKEIPRIFSMLDVEKVKTLLCGDGLK